MRRSVRRCGLSIMEVLFAIGVLTVGLLGVASILPVATNNASQTLKTDRAVEEFNNRVAADVAEISNSFNEVVVANNSLNAFNTAPVNSFRRKERLFEISTLNFGTYIGTYDVTVGPQPVLPDAFCIDPWFLTAAGALRDDQSSTTDDRNGYDRTMFPCYDPRVHPITVSPSQPLSASSGLAVDLPRFTRVGLGSRNAALLAAVNAEAETRRSDDFSVNIPDDTTLGPGLFVQRGGNQAGSLAKNTVTSRFSSIVTLARSATGSNLFNAAVITMQDRDIVTVPGGTFDGHRTPPAGLVPAHNLRPYTAWVPDDPAAPNSFPTDQNLLYPEEVIGYVNAAPRPITGGGGGEFRFRTHRRVRPTVRSGDWLMLMRREYVRAPGTTTIVPGVLKYAWYRVTDVIQKPTLLGDPDPSLNPQSPYETHVAVDGPDWVFHPIQTPIQFGAQTFYAQPYYGTWTQPTWSTAPAFNLDDMPAAGVNPNAPPTYNHFNYGTVVVHMPHVISVKQFQVQL